MAADAAREPATLEAVASAAGVSRATVSRVVNGGEGVSPELRRAVEKAVRQMGYTPNRAARSLVTRRTDSIGLVIPESTTTLFGDPFFGRVVSGISEVIAEADQQLVLLTSQTARDEERVSRYLTGGHVDGVLLVGLHRGDPLPRFLADRGVAVALNAQPQRDLPVSTVDVDNVHGALAAVRHLIEGGRRRVATVTGLMDMASAQDRLAGYRQALSEAGIPYDAGLELHGDWDQDRARASMDELLASGAEVDAVFAASDLMALGALSALRRHGRRVPDDVAIVGFDDSPLALSADPQLSSVRQPIEELGREMARSLLRSIAAKDRVPRSTVLATELVVRGSSAS
jgi:DNA-binding LacI/PurR family transcriptional regulator